MSDWQPIATAPKDGREVLLWYADWYGKPLIISGHRDESEETWEHSRGFGDADMWMPLPAPPSPTHE